MRVRRNISSIPHRSASETWQQIIDLITGTKSRDVLHLKAASGVMGSIITDEHPAVQPILLGGVGAQVRIYCRYGMDAIEEGDTIDPLDWNPTAGDWIMHVPCDTDNIEWIVASLARTSPRIKVFDVDKGEPAEPDGGVKAVHQAAPLIVDWNLRG